MLFKPSIRLLSSNLKIPNTFHLPTVYALSTPPGQRSAIAVIRITGKHVKHIYHNLAKTSTQPIPRRASLRKLYDQTTNSVLDQAVVLYFDGPKTFTGEDILELHVHGGKAVIGGVLKTIQSLNNREKNVDIRFAQPGEFSQRGFQNGRMDLTQVEGIGELIDAETEMQRKSALSSFNGENKLKFRQWRTQLLDSMGQLTAIIDFGEDAEIDDINKIFANVEQNIISLQMEIEKFITKIEKSNLLKSGIKMVLLGEPNVGKSSLLNSISNDEVAIVSNIPGTTRDSIDVFLDIKGFKVVLCDTAGIRSKSMDTIELQGIERAKSKSLYSDIVLLLVDPQKENLISETLGEHVKSQLQSKKIIIVINKTDTVSKEAVSNAKNQLDKIFNSEFPIFEISCKNGQGLSELTSTLTNEFQKITDSSNEADPIIVSKRVQEILSEDVLYGLNGFFEAKQYNDVVMASESLNIASEGIGKITGETIGVEEVLGVVFSNFCVAKLLKMSVIGAFLTKFDVKTGNILLWSSEFDPNIKINYENAEYLSLPSGLHDSKTGEDVVRFVLKGSDQAASASSLFPCVSIFYSNTKDLILAGNTGGVDRKDVRIYSLGVVCKTQTLHPDAEYIEKYVPSLQREMSLMNKEEPDFAKLQSSLPKIQIDEEYQSQIPNKLFKNIGPLIFPLWKSCLLGERLLILIEDPLVKFEELNFLVTYLFKISNYEPSEDASGVDLETLPAVQKPILLYNIGLFNYSNSKIDVYDHTKEHSGFIAYSPDIILKDMTNIYDKILTIGNKGAVKMHDNKGEVIKSTFLDGSKVLKQKDFTNSSNVDKRPWFQYMIDLLYTCFTMNNVSPPYSKYFDDIPVEPPISTERFIKENTSIRCTLVDLIRENRSTIKASEIMKLGLDGFSQQDFQLVAQLYKKLSKNEKKKLNVQWFDLNLFI
ncbi:hypothetical protein ACO0QE_001965 [Hanseniaspora vineae]